jgi:hypothetical protein
MSLFELSQTDFLIEVIDSSGEGENSEDVSGSHKLAVNLE